MNCSVIFLLITMRIFRPTEEIHSNEIDAIGGDGTSNRYLYRFLGYKSLFLILKYILQGE